VSARFPYAVIRLRIATLRDQEILTVRKTTFWKIIDASRKQARGDLDAQLEMLRSRLEQLEPDEIVQFGRIFEEYHINTYTWDLWAAAYLIGGGCSDDGFLDFRGWLISKGKRVYERALEDPESLVRAVKDDDDCQYEGFQYLASQAWEKKTGNKMADFPAHGLSYSSEPAGERWTEDGDDLKRRFPRLWKRFSPPPARWIRIIATPPGEAPPAIRAAWVGCFLQLCEGRDTPERGTVGSGVKSGRPEDHGLVYVVPSRDTILALEKRDARAARWWRKHTPHMLEPGRNFIFTAAACELMPEGWQAGPPGAAPD
jgi:Protein of unknown function (DUF4240)